MAMKQKYGGIGLLELGFIAAGIGVIYWYFGGHSDDGRDLWPALGFSYGPVGNLASIGADFKTGKNRFDGHNALPVQMNVGASVAHQLTDTVLGQLTDTTGTALTDVFAPIASTLFTSRNATGIRDSFNHGGSKPS
jgi:hypothetical protein